MSNKKRTNLPKNNINTRLTLISDGVNKQDYHKTTVYKRETIVYQKQVDRIYEYLRDGMASNEIYATFLSEDDKISEVQFSDMLTDAYKIAEVSLQKDREYVFQLHMDRYEKIYEESMKLTNSWGLPLDIKKDWQIIRARYISALTALEAKEKLIGLHDKSVVLEFNNQKAVVAEKEENRGNSLIGYSVEQLSLEEQVELLGYLKACRTVPIEGIQRVVIKRTIIEINPIDGTRNVNQSIINIDEVEKIKIQDIEYEEMPKNVVKDFKEIPDKEDEEENNMGSMIIEDLTKNTKKELKSGKDVAEAVNKNIISELKERMKKKNLDNKKG